MVDSSFTRNLFNPDSLLGAITLAIIILFIAIISSTIAKKLTRSLIHRNLRLATDKAAVIFIAQLVQVTVFILAAIIYFQLIPALQVLGSAVLATAGVASIVIGLAAQNTLGNMISGLSILIYRPIRLGDRVKVYASAGDETGIVASIDLGYTTLLMSDGEKIIIPNSVLASTVIVNYGKIEATHSETNNTS